MFCCSRLCFANNCHLISSCNFNDKWWQEKFLSLSFVTSWYARIRKIWSFRNFIYCRNGRHLLENRMKIVIGKFISILNFPPTPSLVRIINLFNSIFFLFSGLLDFRWLYFPLAPPLSPQRFDFFLFPFALSIERTLLISSTQTDGNRIALRKLSSCSSDVRESSVKVQDSEAISVCAIFMQ